MLSHLMWTQLRSSAQLENDEAHMDLAVCTGTVLQNKNDVTNRCVSVTLVDLPDSPNAINHLN